MSICDWQGQWLMTVTHQTVVARFWVTWLTSKHMAARWESICIYIEIHDKETHGGFYDSLRIRHTHVRTKWLHRSSQDLVIPINRMVLDTREYEYSAMKFISNSEPYRSRNYVLVFTSGRPCLRWPLCLRRTEFHKWRMGQHVNIKQHKTQDLSLKC